MMRGTRPAAAVALALLLAGQAAAQQPADSAPSPPSDTAAVAPRDVFDVLRRLRGRGGPEPQQPSFQQGRIYPAILPTVGYNPAIQFYAGVALSAGARLGPESTTQISSAYVSATYSTTGALNITARPSIYLAGNRFVLEGDWRYLEMGQTTYGLGPPVLDQPGYDMDFKQVRFQQMVSVEATERLFIGVGYRLDYHFDIHDIAADTGTATPFSDYNGGARLTSTTASGIAFRVFHDSRDNPINARKGFLVSAAVEAYPRGLGSDSTWQAFETEFRSFSATGRGTLAFWGRGWFTFGHAPYMDLPAIGWDRANRTGRGYVQGRIRAPSLLYAEVEYRRPLTRDGLLGFVTFANLTAATNTGGAGFGRAAPGYGAGLRLKLNKRTDTNICVDAGWGFDKSFGVFFASSEVF